MESAATDVGCVMVRQNGELVVHYDDGSGAVCRRARCGTDDPRETTCGACLKHPAWKRAWKAEAKRAKVPQ